MKKINVILLKEICEMPGAPGFEKPIRERILKEIKSLVDESYVDNLGNLVVIKKGVNNPLGKKVMIAAHMDEIGFIVNHIDDNGFVRFNTLGGFDPKTLTAQRVIIHGKKNIIGVMGTKPIHVMSPEDRTKMPKTTDYFIDLGMDKKEVEKVITVGEKKNFMLTNRQIEKFRSLLEYLRSQYNHIFIDIPPLVQDAEALRLSELCDGMILTVNSGSTRWEVLREAKNLLHKTHVPLIGGILNKRKHYIPNWLYNTL